MIEWRIQKPLGGGVGLGRRETLDVLGDVGDAADDARVLDRIGKILEIFLNLFLGARGGLGEEGRSARERRTRGPGLGARGKGEPGAGNDDGSLGRRRGK